MAFALEFPASEGLIDSVPLPNLRYSKWVTPSYFFAFAVTKEAVYLATRKKGFVIRDPLETIRVPLSTIRGVSLEPAPALTASIAFWLLMTLLYALPPIIHFAREQKWEWHGDMFYWASILIVTLVPVISGSRGRYRLRVDTVLSPEPLDFEPRPEKVSSKQKKAAALEAQVRFLDACRRVGLSVADGRT